MSHIIGCDVQFLPDDKSTRFPKTCDRINPKTFVKTYIKKSDVKKKMSFFLNIYSELISTKKALLCIYIDFDEKNNKY